MESPNFISYQRRVETRMDFQRPDVCIIPSSIGTRNTHKNRYRGLQSPWNGTCCQKSNHPPDCIPCKRSTRFSWVLMSSSELHECLRPPSADAAPSIIGGMLHLLREAELHSKRKEITVGQLGFGCNLQESGQSGWRLSLPKPRATSVQAHCGKQQHRKEKS